MVRSYDPKAVTQIIAGVIIEGYAEGEFISVERDEDSANDNSGAQGETVRTITNDRRGTVTVTLQQTSPSNAVFDAQRIALELTGTGIFSMLGKDNLSLDSWAGATSWMLRPATMGFSNEISVREWSIRTDNLMMVVGGQTS